MKMNETGLNLYQLLDRIKGDIAAAMTFPLGVGERIDLIKADLLVDSVQKITEADRKLIEELES